MEWVWFAAVATLAALAVYGWCEVIWARWLPWWRRGLSCLPLALKLTVCGFELAHGSLRLGPSLVRIALTIAGVMLWRWNFRTANRNRDRGDDQRKLEASRASLTAVQATAFRRQAMEAA